MSDCATTMTTAGYDWMAPGVESYDWLTPGTMSLEGFEWLAPGVDGGITAFAINAPNDDWPW